MRYGSNTKNARQQVEPSKGGVYPSFFSCCPLRNSFCSADLQLFNTSALVVVMLNDVCVLTLCAPQVPDQNAPSR